MTNAIDLTVLREITGGDRDLERSLFEMFIASSDICLSAMQQNISNPDETEWRIQAHAWKGSSANLGATKLRELCWRAQATQDAAPEQKRQLLAEIQQEYAAVLQALALEMA